MEEFWVPGEKTVLAVAGMTKHRGSASLRRFTRIHDAKERSRFLDDSIDLTLRTDHERERNCWNGHHLAVYICTTVVL